MKRYHRGGYKRRYEALVQLRIHMGEVMYADFLTDLLSEYGGSPIVPVDQYQTRAVMWLVKKLMDAKVQDASPKVVRLQTIAEKISA